MPQVVAANISQVQHKKSTRPTVNIGRPSTMGSGRRASRASKAALETKLKLAAEEVGMATMRSARSNGVGQKGAAGGTPQEDRDRVGFTFERDKVASVGTPMDRLVVLHAELQAKRRHVRHVGAQLEKLLLQTVPNRPGKG